jgi:hypothetical protein
MRDGVVKPRVEAANDVVDEILVDDRGAEAGKAICHDFHARAVVKDGQVTLVEVAEFGAEVDGAHVLVVADEVADGAPDGVGGVVVLGHHGEELGRDPIVEPGDDGTIVLNPVVVALGRRAVDMIAETILAEDRREGTSPGDVVGFIEVEDDRHAVEDVDPMNNRRCSWFGLDAVCGGGRTRRRSCHRRPERRKRSSWRHWTERERGGAGEGWWSGGGRRGEAAAFLGW